MNLYSQPDETITPTFSDYPETFFYDENPEPAVEERWKRLVTILEEQFQKRPNLEAILFLIGIRELGILPRKFTKEEKMNLMHIAVCAVLSRSGYYRLIGQDADGWPHWELVKPLPLLDIFYQVNFLRAHILDYFSDIYELQ
ncbi:MAG: hypothetical protein NZ108_00780 [Bacteroidia bacterium]|nr:hypothetical protein [Bacteroidia bacterium]